MTGRRLLSVPGHRHCRPCIAFSSFFGPFSVPPLVTVFTLQKALRLRNVPFFYFCSPGLGLRVLAFAVWVGFPPGWNGGFHLWRLPGESLDWGHTFFNRLILPGSRALGAGLPGIPGSWSLELLLPSRSGCMQLPLPLLFITPFAILVFLRENFGFEGVDGVFGSWFWAGDHLWVFLPLRPRLLLTKLARWSGGSGAWLPLFLFPFPLGSSSLLGYWKRSWSGTSRLVVPISAWGIALPSLWR